MTAAFDSREFRDAMSLFATGVTVLTVSHAGVRRGMTANAFTSVSLDPPLLLVSIARKSSMLPLIESAEFFGINILGHDQGALSRIFSHDTDESQDILQNAIPQDNSVKLPGVLAYLECKNYCTYDGGDHLLIIGRVQAIDVTSGTCDPLVFFNGFYRNLGNL